MCRVWLLFHNELLWHAILRFLRIIRIFLCVVFHCWCFSPSRELYYVRLCRESNAPNNKLLSSCFPGNCTRTGRAERIIRLLPRRRFIGTLSLAVWLIIVQWLNATNFKKHRCNRKAQCLKKQTDVRGERFFRLCF